jgi:hypothetical protein
MKWYERKPERYNAEVKLIMRNHRKARLFIDKGRLVVFLKIRGRKADYIAKIIYPEEFPYEQPEAYIVEPRIKEAPHRWSDGHLSIHGIKDGPDISGKIILDWTKLWVLAFENWLDTGRWPKKNSGG